MTYFKILMLSVATIAALGTFADSDKAQKNGHAKVMFGSGFLFLLAVCIEIMQSHLL